MRRGRERPLLHPDSPTNQLIGFVANSERNELAMFRYCDKDSALVDLDREAPGYNFIPAGHLPSALTITDDSCRVLSANTGSCDLTVLDVAGFAAYAVDTPLSGQDAPQLPAASSLVSTLVPRRSDGLPLAASPGSVIAAPDFLSLASDGTGLPSGDTGDGGDDMGGSDDSTFEPGGSGARPMTAAPPPTTSRAWSATCSARPACTWPSPRASSWPRSASAPRRSCRAAAS